MPTPSPVATLDQIRKGQRVRVVATTGENDSIARRLDDLGIRAGVEIEVIRRAPLGDPTVFELCGYQLCLRKSESSRVKVTTAATGGRTTAATTMTTATTASGVSGVSGVTTTTTASGAGGNR